MGAIILSFAVKGRKFSPAGWFSCNQRGDHLAKRVTYSAIINYSRATLNVRPATVIGTRATVIVKPATVIGEPATVVVMRATVVGGHATVVGKPATVIGRCATVVERPATVIVEPATVVDKPAQVIGEPALSHAFLLTTDYCLLTTAFIPCHARRVSL